MSGHALGARYHDVAPCQEYALLYQPPPGPAVWHPAAITPVTTFAGDMCAIAGGIIFTLYLVALVAMFGALVLITPGTFPSAEHRALVMAQCRPAFDTASACRARLMSLFIETPLDELYLSRMLRDIQGRAPSREDYRLARIVQDAQADLWAEWSLAHFLTDCLPDISFSSFSPSPSP